MTKKVKLTLKQQKIIEFVRNFSMKERMAPTIQEIADFFNIKTSTTFAHIASLQKKGVLKRSSKARSIALLGEDIAKPFHTSFSLPTRLLGRINAGYAIDMEQDMGQDSKSIQFDSSLFKSNRKNDEFFCLEITGESMQEAGLLDGDYVIVKKASKVKDGDIVVALVNKSETTVKYYKKHSDSIELKPANKDYTACKYSLEQIEIQGIVVGLQRKL